MFGGERILWALVSLLLTLLAIVACAWLLKRMQFGPMGQGQQAMKILAVLPLGSRERLLLVQVGHTQLLLGATAQAIHTLHVFDQPLDLAQPEALSPFAEKFKQLLKGKV